MAKASSTIKIILLILSLLVAGFAAGFFTHRYLTLQRIERVAEMRVAPGFKRHFFHTIEADSAQRAQLTPIIDKYARRIAEIHRESRKERHKLVMAMRSEIEPFLKAEQLDRMQRIERRFRDKMPPPHRPRHRKRKKRGEGKEKFEERDSLNE